MPAARTVPGPQGPGDQLQGVGQLARRTSSAGAPLVPQPQPAACRTASGRRAARRYSGTLGQRSCRSCPSDRQHQADAEQRARLDVAVGLLEQLLQADRNFGVSSSMNDFLSFSNADFAQDVRAASSSSAAFADQHVEPRRPSSALSSRNTKASMPISAATDTAASSGTRSIEVHRRSPVHSSTFSRRDSRRVDASALAERSRLNRLQSRSSTRSWNRFDGSLMPAASSRLTKVGRTPVASNWP